LAESAKLLGWAQTIKTILKAILDAFSTHHNAAIRIYSQPPLAIFYTTRLSLGAQIEYSVRVCIRMRAEKVMYYPNHAPTLQSFGNKL
jgi:hypothetical protein